MSAVVVGMTVSLDGYVQDADGKVGQLYPDLAQLGGYLAPSIARTGAVLMGRRTWEMGDPDGYVKNYEYQVPIFVVTHRPPTREPKQDNNLTFTFITDGVGSAVSRAKAAAGPEKAVTVVGGPQLIRQLFVAGLVDELQLDVVPVFLGGGLRLFDAPELAGVRLRKLDVLPSEVRTGLRFQVER